MIIIIINNYIYYIRYLDNSIYFGWTKRIRIIGRERERQEFQKKYLEKISATIFYKNLKNS